MQMDTLKVDFLDYLTAAMAQQYDLKLYTVIGTTEVHEFCIYMYYYNFKTNYYYWIYIR